MEANKYLQNWASQMKKGIVPYLVLRELSAEVKYGYDLLRSINDSLEFAVTDGTLYPMLIKMHDAGLLEYKWVEQSSGIPRKYYTMTDKGRTVLNEMQKHLAGLSLFGTKNKSDGKDKV